MCCYISICITYFMHSLHKQNTLSLKKPKSRHKHCTVILSYMCIYIISDTSILRNSEVLNNNNARVICHRTLACLVTPQMRPCCRWNCCVARTLVLIMTGLIEIIGFISFSSIIGFGTVISKSEAVNDPRYNLL